MQSSFLIARSVFFAVLVNLNLLVLVFAAWNANATVAAGQSVSATAVFLILNSCSAFFFVALSLAELLVRQAYTSRLLFECCWLAVLSIFQTGTAISITVNGPEICQSTSDWNLCASSYLLIPTSWLSTLVALSYFFVVFFTTAAHSRIRPGIWHETVCSVEWFNKPSVPTVSVKGDQSSESDSAPYSKPTEDVEASPNPAEGGKKAPWAGSSNIRRGVDMPFRRQGPPSTVRSSTSTAIAGLPVVPLNIQGNGVAGSRFIEKFRESQLTYRSGTSIRYELHFMTRGDPFPAKVDNHDLPIPLPRLSEWIRADAMKGINVHTMPQSP